MHLAWRWFTGLGFDQEIPHHSTFSGREAGVVRRLPRKTISRIEKGRLHLMSIHEHLPLQSCDKSRVLIRSLSRNPARFAFLGGASVIIILLWFPRALSTLASPARG
jgi:hypothetical protein